MKRVPNTFGDWIRFQLQNHQITIINLSDYSGIHIRKLYRIINGENKLYYEDWIWLVECVGDMTNQSLTECVIDCVEYMNPSKWDTMSLKFCPVCGCDPCDCHPNGVHHGTKYIYPKSRSFRTQSDRKSYPQIHGSFWNGIGSSHGGRHPFGIVGKTQNQWIANQQTQSHKGSPNTRPTVGGPSSNPGNEKRQHTKINSGSREHSWKYLWQRVWGFQSHTTTHTIQPVEITSNEREMMDKHQYITLIIWLLICSIVCYLAIINQSNQPQTIYKCEKSNG